MFPHNRGEKKKKKEIKPKEKEGRPVPKRGGGGKEKDESFPTINTEEGSPMSYKKNKSPRGRETYLLIEEGKGKGEGGFSNLWGKKRREKRKQKKLSGRACVPKGRRKPLFPYPPD